MTHTITIELSETMFQQLERAAELAQKPVQVIVESSLAHSLAPLLQDIPGEYQRDVYPLLEMNDAELLQEALRRFPADRWSEYETLLDKNQATALSPDEQSYLNTLRREADILGFRKGYAAVLLKRRGYQPPSLQALSEAA